MSLKAGTIPDMPDLACMGIVKKVGEVRLSNKGVYHVLPIEIEGKAGGRNGTYFFLFQPRWFGKTFDPAQLMDEDEAIRLETDPETGKKRTSALYTMYRRYVNDEKKASALKCLAGENWNSMVGVFDGLAEVNEKVIEQVLREFLTGNEVVYVMTQRTEDDGSLTEQYNIQRFVPATVEGAKSVVKESENPRRRRPLVITWDE